jgi:hypothetical protein
MSMNFGKCEFRKMVKKMKGKKEILMTYMKKRWCIARAKMMKVFDYFQRRLRHQKGKAPPSLFSIFP